MNENEFDRTARAWLEDGPTRISDRAVLSALEEIHTTRQRRAWWPARRATPVNIFVRAAIAAVLVVGVGLVAINVLPRQGDGSGVGGQPSASPPPSASPSLSPAPSAADIPELTQTYVSSLNGFSIGYPDDATIEPAAAVWSPLDTAQGYAGFDFIRSESLSVFRSASTEAPDGESVDEWIDEFITGAAAGNCNAPRSTLPQVIIDGQAGRIRADCPDEIEATVVVGRRVYLFTLFDDGISRALFDTYASTIDLRPEDAASPVPS